MKTKMRVKLRKGCDDVQEGTQGQVHLKHWEERIAEERGCEERTEAS